jgi:hypothetical protein
MFKVTLNVCTDSKSYRSEGFVLKADHATKQNVWYCKICDGSFIPASEITRIAFPRHSNVKLFTTFSGNGCVLDFFEWMDTNKDTLESEGYSIDDYRSVSSSFYNSNCPVIG